MPRTYGTILDSSAVGITRLVPVDGGVRLQTFRIDQEVSLTHEEVAAMLTALAEDSPFRTDPVLQRLLAAQAPSWQGDHTTTPYSMLNLRGKSLADAILRLPEDTP